MKAWARMGQGIYGLYQTSKPHEGRGQDGGRVNAEYTGSANTMKARCRNNGLRSCEDYTRPANPMKARARMPAVTSEMGTPFIPEGMLASSSCSRIPAMITSARPKPMAVAPP